jgi:hypothetical protein
MDSGSLLSLLPTAHRKMGHLRLSSLLLCHWGLARFSLTISPPLTAGPQRLTLTNPDGETVSLDAAVTAN